MVKSMRVLSIVVPLAAAALAHAQEPSSPGTRRITFRDYEQCIELSNGETRVVLCADAGGRVLEYAWNGENALYLDEQDRGSVDSPSISAGRFDIGPEQIIPRHPRLWAGRWTGEITGPRAARLTSAIDDATGVQLVREFRLAERGTHLVCTQTIKNVSDEAKEWCHWSRTFARGNGICVIPLTAPSRFPKNYVMYQPDGAINFQPDDPHIGVRDGFLEITGVPKHPKLGMDSYAGWFGYLMPHDVLFVKRFPTFPDRVYNEVAGLTISIWYPAGRRVELEPIGPRERLAPGAAASFTEDWWLLPYDFPKNGAPVDLKSLARLVDETTIADGPQ